MTTMTTAWLHDPKQDRSRETTRRILRAAGRLLNARSIDDVSVVEIAQAAEVSIGGYYARFPSKESLLSALYDECLRAATRKVEEVTRKELWTGQPLRVVVRAYLSSAMRFFCKNRNIVRQVIARARESRDSPLGRAVAEFNSLAHGRLTALLLERAEQIHHSRPAEAAHFGVRVVSAALRDFTLFGARSIKPDSQEAQHLLDELTRVYAGYLESRD